jgi:hypothetical protein
MTGVIVTTAIMIAVMIGMVIIGVIDNHGLPGS